MVVLVLGYALPPVSCMSKWYVHSVMRCLIIFCSNAKLFEGFPCEQKIYWSYKIVSKTGSADLDFSQLF